MIRKHFTTLAIAAAVIVPTPVLLAVTHASEAPAASSRVCFSAASWDANDAKRPCVRVTNVEEDGSFGYAVTDADGTVRYTAGAGALDR